MKSNEVIAASLSMDASELKEYRYQAGKTSRPVFAIGAEYFATGSKAPTDAVAGPWQLHKDQFFAGRAGTSLWVAS